MGKCSLKTFPFKVVLDDNESLIEAEFGIKGYAVLVKLYQAIYARGYYMKWDIDTQLLFIRDYCLSEVGRNVVSEIVTCCVRRGVFESTLFEKYQILTSKRIQETFLTATRRNTEVIIDECYALPIVYDFIDNANKKGKTVNIFLKNDNSMSTVCNKRKENKKKIKRNIIDTQRARENLQDLSSMDIPERTESQKKFFNDFEIQIDNYSPNFGDMDFDLIYSAYVDSANFLQQHPQARFLSWICRNYKKIIGGYYKDKVAKPQKKSMNDLLRELNEEDLAEQDDGED